MGTLSSFCFVCICLLLTFYLHCCHGLYFCYLVWCFASYTNVPCWTMHSLFSSPEWCFPYDLVVIQDVVCPSRDWFGQSRFSNPFDVDGKQLCLCCFCCLECTCVWCVIEESLLSTQPSIWIFVLQFCMECKIYFEFRFLFAFACWFLSPFHCGFKQN